MTLDEIKATVEAGKTVHWSTTLYSVVRDRMGRWFILCTSNGSAIGLTWLDGKTLNGKVEDFFGKD